MNGTQAVDTLIFRLGRGTRVSSAFRSQVLLELQTAQRRLEDDPSLPWFLLADRSHHMLTQYEERVALPSDFVRENEEDELRIKISSEPDTSYTALKKDHWDSVPLPFRPGVFDRPRYFTLWGEYLILSPAPDRADYIIQMTYWKRDTLIALETENLWLRYAPDFLMAEAGINLAIAIGNQGALQLFTSQRLQMKTLLHNQTIARQETNRDPNPEN